MNQDLCYNCFIKQGGSENLWQQPTMLTLKKCEVCGLEARFVRTVDPDEVLCSKKHMVTEVTTEEHSGNWGVNWTEDELEIFYGMFVGIKYQSQEFNSAVQEARQLLDRSTWSILWHYKHMFLIDDPRAGKLIIALKTRKGITVYDNFIKNITV